MSSDAINTDSDISSLSRHNAAMQIMREQLQLLKQMEELQSKLDAQSKQANETHETRNVQFGEMVKDTDALTERQMWGSSAATASTKENADSESTKGAERSDQSSQ